jgi:preprotein translocase subunit Sec61beta
VSFRLAEEGVSGEFANGLRTELVLTGVDGRAVCPAISWGAFAGPGRLRVTAAQGEARAGILVPYYLSADPSLALPPGQVVVAGSAVAPQVQPVRMREAPGPKVKKKRRWVRWVASIAVGVGGGLALGLVRRGGGGRAAEVAGPGVSIGVPTITVGGVR